jgi:hypothetical protein
MVLALLVRGSHGIRNNASKATKNDLYVIDIITLFRLLNLTSHLLCVYSIPYVNTGADAKHSDRTTLLAHF